MAELFVWRSDYSKPEYMDCGDFAYWGEWKACPYCQAPIEIHNEIRKVSDYPLDEQFITSRQCLLCGWNTYEFNWPSPSWGSADYHAKISALRSFELSSEQILLDELGTYLKTNFSDIYSLNPIRFEALIADVFRHFGFDARLTTSTRDGGVDVFLSRPNSQEVDAIVECKRYAKERTVGIGFVQRVAGAAIEWGAQKAKIVTSATFSKVASGSAKKITDSGLIEVDLVDATRLLELLQVYNTNLPALHLLGERHREMLIAENRERVRK